MSGGKPVLSSRVMGLKFMQRGREKEEKAAAEAVAEEREAEASGAKLSRAAHLAESAVDQQLWSREAAGRHPAVQ